LKFAGDGGVGEMKRNIQHSTFNAEHPMKPRTQRPIGRWMLNVECWMFLPFFIFTSSLSAQTSQKNMLPPLAPAYGQMQPTFWEQHGTIVLVLGFIVIVSTGVLCWLLFSPKPPIPVPPEILARETLTKLSRQPEDGRVLSEISQALRRYIVSAFQFPVGELTTGEFSATLAGSQKIAGDLANTVSSFLRECDERKFSPTNPDTPLNAASRALEIVSQAEKQRTPPQIPK
jgi:hypothetical protein